jgi:hypothetical protein
VDFFGGSADRVEREALLFLKKKKQKDLFESGPSAFDDRVSGIMSAREKADLRKIVIARRCSAGACSCTTCSGAKKMDCFASLACVDGPLDARVFLLI